MQVSADKIANIDILMAKTLIMNGIGFWTKVYLANPNPLIDRGSWLLIKKVDRYRTGDIIAIDAEKIIIIKRIVSCYNKNGRKFFMAKLESSEFVPIKYEPQHILGKVVRIKSNGKQIILGGFIMLSIDSCLAYFSRRICTISKKKKIIREYNNFWKSLISFSFYIQKIIGSTKLSNNDSDGI